MIRVVLFKDPIVFVFAEAFYRFRGGIDTTEHGYVCDHNLFVIAGRAVPLKDGKGVLGSLGSIESPAIRMIKRPFLAKEAVTSSQSTSSSQVRLWASNPWNGDPATSDNG